MDLSLVCGFLVLGIVGYYWVVLDACGHNLGHSTPPPGRVPALWAGALAIVPQAPDTICKQRQNREAHLVPRDTFSEPHLVPRLRFANAVWFQRDTYFEQVLKREAERLSKGGAPPGLMIGGAQ